MPIESIDQIVEEFKAKKQIPELATFKDYEIYMLAIQLQRNQILEAAFVVSRNDSQPNPLEALAITLGYNKHSIGNVLTALHDISSGLEDTNETLKQRLPEQDE